MKKENGYTKGFTLIEILVIVLIIAVLATVAVSAYQRAVVKSRFSSLMPTTKAIRDGQEDYYMRNGTYATAIADLDVKASNTSGMDIAPGDSTDTDLKYVFATRPTLNNNLIMYQKGSPKFAGHTHCEALKDNSLAEWLCADALHGTKIEGSVSGDEYDTYVLEGELGPNDYFGKACEGSGKQACSCGGPIAGTCNNKTGEWSYSGECPSPLPAKTEECTGGKIGKKKGTSVCNGNAYEYQWTDGCLDNTWYNRTFIYEQEVKDAQAEYAANHNGQYATSLSQLGSNFQCPEGAVQCKISDNRIKVYYGSPSRPNESTYSIETDYITGRRTCWGSSWSGYGGYPAQRCQEAGGVRISGTESYLISE